MKIFVVQEKLGQEGQVLAVDRIFIAVDLENCNFVFFIPVDLITGRVEERTHF